MSGSQFVERVIDVTFELGSGSFQEAPGKNAVTLTGLRVVAQIANSGTIGAGAQIRIWGMSDSQMARLSTVGLLLPYMNSQVNFVTVAVGNKGSPTRTIVYRGVIYAAWTVFDDMPETFFNVSSTTTFRDQIAPVAATSYSGAADVGTIMAGLAQQMNRPFHNLGVNQTVSNPYFPGTADQQAKRLAQAAGINMNIDPATGALEIWPRDGVRQLPGDVQIISKDTGLIRIPTFTENGIIVQAVFNASVRFGSEVDIKSALPRSSGRYVVRQMSYYLESEVPGGQWNMTLGCYAPGVVVIPNPGPF